MAETKETDETDPMIEIAKTMAMMCVRNTMLENIHAGLLPVTKTGDYSDVMVVDADGRQIPWNRVSHFDDDTMRDFMREVVDRLYTFVKFVDDPRFVPWINLWAREASKWDDPRLDSDFMYVINRNADVDS